MCYKINVPYTFWCMGMRTFSVSRLRIYPSPWYMYGAYETNVNAISEIIFYSTFNDKRLFVVTHVRYTHGIFYRSRVTSMSYVLKALWTARPLYPQAYISPSCFYVGRKYSRKSLGFREYLCPRIIIRITGMNTFWDNTQNKNPKL